MDTSESDSSTSPNSEGGKFGLLVTTVLFSLVALFLLIMPWIFGAPDSDRFSDTVRFFGRFHPMVLHLPIGILSLVALYEIANLIPGVRKVDTQIMLFFSAVTSVFAVVAGFLLYLGDGHTSETAQDHLWGGISLAILVMIAFLCKAWSKRLVFARLIAPLVVFAACGLLAWTAHRGAAMTHGASYLTRYAPEWLPEPLFAMLGDGSPRPEKTEAPVVEDLLPSEGPVFEHVIQPILTRSCLECHSADNTKGKLRMDTIDFMLAGGSDGPAVVSGSSEESYMMERIHLPPDDDERMPPADKEDIQLEDHEIVLLEWWIDSGLPVDDSVVSLDAPEEIVNAANRVGTSERKPAL